MLTRIVVAALLLVVPAPVRAQESPLPDRERPLGTVATPSAEEGVPRQAARPALELATYTGLSIDTFAADDLSRYLNPEAATGEQVRISAGLTFGYLIGSHIPIGKFWLIGSARYGVRSADVDCQSDPKLGVCQPFSGRRDAWLYVLRHARTVEASGGLRWEFWPLSTGGSDPATLYVLGQAGLLTAAGSGDDAADMHRLVAGLRVTGGRHAGSYVEAGWGRSDVYSASPARRLVVDGYFRLGTYRAVSPFVQVSVDADLGPGTDSLQTHVGAAVDLK